MAHLHHLIYLLRHKFFVLRAGRRREVSLWQLLVHDCSKFLPSEFLPYTRRFFQQNAIDSTDFRKAFELHCKRNAHHWEHWLTPAGPVEMPYRYVNEMLADWDGAGEAKVNGLDTPTWYKLNRNSIVLHPLTRIVVDYKLGVPNEALASLLHECTECGMLFRDNIAIMTNGESPSIEQQSAVFAYLATKHQDH